MPCGARSRAPARAESAGCRALELLARELPQQILADGGHCERSPSRHLAVLNLVDIKSMLRGWTRAAKRTAGRDRSMGPTLRLFQHGDGGLALFNGSQEEAGWVDMVLRRANARRQPRLSRLRVVSSAFRRDAPGDRRRWCSGHSRARSLRPRETLAMGSVLVVSAWSSCGAPGLVQPARWQQAVRATAAHYYPGRNQFGRPGHTSALSRSQPSAPSRDGAMPPGRAGRRSPSGNAAMAIGCPMGVHHRRLYLSAEGDDLRGEDRIEIVEPSLGARGLPRHPLISSWGKRKFPWRWRRALRLPKGDGWRLRAAGADGDSGGEHYFGEGEAQKHPQLVLRGSLEDYGAG